MMTKRKTARRKRRARFAYLCIIAVAVVSFSASPLSARRRRHPQPRRRAARSRNSSARQSEGDLTVVEFFDYQCPYCKKLAPEIAQLLTEDGNIRLVLKDWPIFGDVSKSAAQLALAAKYQDKYVAGPRCADRGDDQTDRRQYFRSSHQGRRRCRQGEARPAAHQKTIDDLWPATATKPRLSAFKARPGFIVGTFRVPGVVEMKVFKQIIADARTRAKKQRKS